MEHGVACCCVTAVFRRCAGYDYGFGAPFPPMIGPWLVAQALNEIQNHQTARAITVAPIVMANICAVIACAAVGGGGAGVCLVNIVC
jgi:hypothetical protein